MMKPPRKKNHDPANAFHGDEISVGRTVRHLREQRRMSAVELCRRAGGLNPKTLAAVEAGRIKNPSIRTLQFLARGFGISIGDLFRSSEAAHEGYYCPGTPQGVFHVDFLKKGIRLVSWTPRTAYLFCGKMILSSHARFDESLFKFKGSMFVSVLIGRLESSVEGRPGLLKEGDNLFFNACLRHSFYNPHHKETTILVVSAPSVFCAS